MSELSQSDQKAYLKLAPSKGGGAFPEQSQRLRKRLLAIVGGLLACAIGLGISRHMDLDRESANFSKMQADQIPHVRSIKLAKRTEPIRLEFPGQTLAIEQARLFPRVTGFVAERRVDIGARVKKGELLARIVAPDLDQQFVQAEAQLTLAKAQLAQSLAQLEQTRANLGLAKTTQARSAALVKQNFESRQNFDNATANAQFHAASFAAAEAAVEVARANIAAQQATVDRLRELTGFESILAPYDGVVSARNIAEGDLVAADAIHGAPLFVVERDDLLRVRLAAPQSVAIQLVDGVNAEVLIPEIRGKRFKGRVSRNSSSLDVATRTLLVEIDIENGDRLLKPGLFARIFLELPRAHPGITVPAQSIFFGADGAQVAEIDRDGAIRIRTVTIARDFGASVEIGDGLTGDETIAIDPPVNIYDGKKVLAR